MAMLLVPGAAISTDVDYHSSLQHFHNILFDPTSNINTGEGIKGYTLFFVTDLKNHFVYWHYAQIVNGLQKLRL